MKIDILQDWGVNYSELTLQAPDIWVADDNFDYYEEGNIVLRQLDRSQLDEISKILIDNCFDIRIKNWMRTANGPKYELVICVGVEQVDYKIY